MDIYVAQAIAFCVSFPSIVLYLLECVVICSNWHKSFNTSFFRLFLFTAFNNLTLVLCLVPIVRISELGFFVDFYLQQLPAWLAKTYFCLSLFAFHVENFLTVFVIAHRLSAIVWPLSFEQFWHYGLPLSVLASTVGSIALTIPLFSLDINFVEDKQNKLFRRVITGYHRAPDAPIFNVYQHVFITCAIFLAISTVLNFAILLAYKWHRRTTQAREQQHPSQRFKETLEFRLYVYTMAMFVGQLLQCVFWILAYIYTLFPVQMTPFWRSFNSQYVWFNDCRVLAFPAWFLFWASNEVSNQVRKLLAKSPENVRKGGKWLLTGMKRILQKRKGSNAGGQRRLNEQMFVVRMPHTERRWSHPVVNVVAVENSNRI